MARVMMQSEKLPYQQNLSDPLPQNEQDGLRSKAKAKAKRLLRIDDDDSSSENNEEEQFFDSVVEEIHQSPAFDAAKVLNTSSLGNGSRIKRTKNILQGTADAIVHPVASIKSKATKKTAGKLAKSRPYLSNQAKFDFLEAHDALQQAKDDQHSSDDGGVNEGNLDKIDYYENKVHTLERDREEIRVAWVTNRHVHRVRVVDTTPAPFPSDQYFEAPDDHGYAEFKWEKYIGYYAYIVYATAKNYYYPSVSALREEVSRNIDRGATALKAGELMEKHGNKHWLGPLLEQTGPYLQVQIADLANLLEVYDSFFHFRRPQNTFYSLFLFLAVFLLSVCASIQFTMKVFWFVVGLVFFGCWPISSLYPQYRLLVSPLKWAFWDIPTYSEWSLQYLQERGSSTLEKINSQPSRNINTRVGGSEITVKSGSHNEDDNPTVGSESVRGERQDILSFNCTLHHIPGRLILSTSTIRFEPSVPNVLSRKTFDKPYGELIEMSKRETEDMLLAQLAKATIGRDKLELKFRGEAGSDMQDACQNGHIVVLLENIKGRDKAFNTIIAFSGVRWQCLQKTPGKLTGKENRSSNA
ncbi:hypothetical protein SS1G_13248 [Sclerotinia sclerotiorum 1980 UF-70]|uniref:Uncharacterized protein n=1 Tax=Sclerotinia sclerotiorum (strain ATCC 18683 / 1980 / Ss-1) TaxID=665079 RepID=A7F6L9_SCLS1|nr:hypothetical protein SS1G_13248 [Sclerotinia sclerotiorum 1980 UF-70]EDN98390.1 hypothetical protein SS1G_13248 [Sclerotinia sclerotiorum 1980 UF-70]